MCTFCGAVFCCKIHFVQNVLNIRPCCVQRILRCWIDVMHFAMRIVLFALICFVCAGPMWGIWDVSVSRRPVVGNGGIVRCLIVIVTVLCLLLPPLLAYTHQVVRFQQHTPTRLWFVCKLWVLCIKWSCLWAHRCVSGPIQPIFVTPARLAQLRITQAQQYPPTVAHHIYLFHNWFITPAHPIFLTQAS